VYKIMQESVIKQRN